MRADIRVHRQNVMPVIYTDFNQATNPNHLTLNLSTECITCHTTEPDWNPALFPDHDDIYPLLGAHAAIANQCVNCHNGEYNNTPNTCVGCHMGDYNQTDNPPHIALNFSTECVSCHTESAWSPANIQNMTGHISRSIVVHMKACGINARNVTPIRVIIQYSPVSRVTRIPKQTSSMPVLADIFMKAQHVSPVIRQEMHREHLITTIQTFR